MSHPPGVQINTECPQFMEDHHDKELEAFQDTDDPGIDISEKILEETDAISSHPSNYLHGSEDDFPDGGLRAWLVVLGGFCNILSSVGFVNSWGSFQSYYELNTLGHKSTSEIAWIGSTQYALTFLPGVISGRLFDLGWYRLPLFVSSCFLVLTTFLTAQCTTYWHFILCQGLALGLCSGMVTGPTPTVISTWFKHRRSTAFGIIAGGSSVGGTIFPIIFRNLVGKIGFPWTMRVIGFILILTLGITNLTLERRLKPVNISGGMFNPKVFRSRSFTLYAISTFVSFLGLYTVLTYVDVSASATGIPETFSLYLVSIANAGSFFGRLAAGLLADYTGALNIIIPFTTIAGILTYIWPHVRGKGNYVAIAVTYGFSSGAYLSLLPAPMIAMGDTGDMGRRVGVCWSMLAIGALIGPPISGAINGATHGFNFVGVYAGTMVLVSVMLMVMVRSLLLGRLWGKV
ncbi:MFS general substrate transporter [Rickenella mellea]|uniref:MFS general substrate transporter n=1 Tax=Rickenella mellea TaxID=50990 RepID=A0A4Y7QAZ4_9AGAM|nr:MFS general substrate transporter [Rickenella mellea]